MYQEAASEEAIAAYAGPAKAHMEQHGGRFIARGLPAATFEGGHNERSVIIEFDSVEAAVAAFGDEAYQSLVPTLGGVTRDVRIIPGT